MSISVKTKRVEDKMALVRGADATLWRMLVSSFEEESPPATDAEISEKVVYRDFDFFLFKNV